MVIVVLRMREGGLWCLGARGIGNRLDLDAPARARASFAFFIGPPCMPSTTRLPMAVTALREVVLRDLVAAVAHWARAFFASRRSFKTGAPAAVGGGMVFA